MTALDRLRHRLGPDGGTTPRAFFDLETVRALLELADAAGAYVRGHLPSTANSELFAAYDLRVALLKLENLP